MTKNGSESRMKHVELRLAMGALGVSIVALLLSQVRPLHELLEQPELRLAVAPNIEVGNMLGHIEFTRYVTLSNTGRKAGTALRTQMFVARLDAGAFDKVFPAGFVSVQPPQFFNNPGSIRVPWHPVTIAVDSDWTSYVSYTQQWSAEESAAAGVLVKKAGAELPPAPQSGAHISEETFTALSHFVDAHLDGFGVGRYGVLTYFWDSGSTAPKIDKCDVIDVSDVNMQTFRDNVERYRTGLGLVYPNGPIPIFVVNTRDCDAQTTEELKKRFDVRKQQ